MSDRTISTIVRIINISIMLIMIAYTIYYCMANNKKDPYAVGEHIGYSIECENGFKYKVTKYHAIQLKNTDGTDMLCY